MDNKASFNGHVLGWKFDIVNGKASFRMGAGFKNDIPKDIIHTVADTVDSFLAKVDSISTIFTDKVNKFIELLRKYIPFKAKDFVRFLSEAIDIISRTKKVRNFASSFNQLQKIVKEASKSLSEFWLRNIGTLLKKLSINLPKVGLIKFRFLGALRFLENLQLNLSKFRLATHGSVIPNIKLFDFSLTLGFTSTLHNIKISLSRLLNFFNTFSNMKFMFDNFLNVDFPRFGINLPSTDLRFFPSLDWRLRFNLKSNFTGLGFKKFLEFFPNFADIFQAFGDPNIDFQQLLNVILPRFRLKLRLYEVSGGLNILKWFRISLQSFRWNLKTSNLALFNLSKLSLFLDELIKWIEKLSIGPLPELCKVQNFVLGSADTLETFGNDIEKKWLMKYRTLVS
ncbi:uncharacterized protein LOC124451470 [Xenia sp. Carnegie-2017]|uniref:uncharacterized protein LOC124451470 n=1 Tax=Xenia sp. Carnegie-2017 TaxID=2897299 RepID=UPI001F03CE52|nr:uncharacterized protein LOC124451470 [Xenia sp. Carnegie-2017]XP_046858058.1 uncharacterized protein LOC124451470 [Xenia sp. Carnegie-2017]